MDLTNVHVQEVSAEIQLLDVSKLLECVQMEQSVIETLLATTLEGTDIGK